jgi:hypothetical protein
MAVVLGMNLRMEEQKELNMLLQVLENYLMKRVGILIMTQVVVMVINMPLKALIQVIG